MHRYHLRIIVLVYVLKVRNYFPTSVLLSVWIMICADAFLDNGSSPYTSQWECKSRLNQADAEDQKKVKYRSEGDQPQAQVNAAFFQVPSHCVLRFDTWEISSLTGQGCLKWILNARGIYLEVNSLTQVQSPSALKEKRNKSLFHGKGDN